MFVIDAVKGKMLILGRVGENQARAVRFNTACIQAEFPGATVSILNRRQGDDEAYPVNGQFITEENGSILWVLQSGDLAEEGLGECEMKASLNGQIVKDDIYDTKVLRALDESAEPPEPWESWVEQVENDADRAEDAAEDSEAWAVGERGGVPVVEGDPTYENNAKYYAEQAEETLASKADKVDTVLETTLSRGRKSTAAKGTASIAFGTDVVASGSNSTAVGSNTKAMGNYSSASGLATEASGSSSHAEGSNTIAAGQGAHAEGYNTSASGQYSHSENTYTTARGTYSHAEGSHTTASHRSQHVFGEYNEEDNPSGSAANKGAFIEIVGNGTASNAKSNARTLDWDGNERLKGDLYVGANSDGTGGTKVAKITEIPEPVDISGKADKVSGATNDHLAALDGNGNLKDSGKAAADFVAAEDFRADAMPMSASDPTKVATEITGLKSAIQQKAPLIFDTVSNVAIASVSDAIAHPVISLKIGIEPVQSGSGDPSPSNIRPITGWDAVVLSQSGGNLLPNLKYQRNTSKVMLGQDTTDTNYPIYLKAGTYVLTVVNAVTANYFIKAQNGEQTGITNGTSFSVAENGYYQFYAYKSNGVTTSDITSFCLNVGSTASSYTAYTGQTHTASLPSTVFGGVIDWVGSKAYAEMGIRVFTGENTEGWNYSVRSTGTEFRVYTGVLTDAKVSQADMVGNYIAGNGEVVNYPAEWKASISANGTLCIGVPSTITSADDWKTFLASNNLVIVYKLATPTEIPLSDLDEISTIAGENNLWADSGDIVELTYACDTKGYIDKKFTELQALILENS